MEARYVAQVLRMSIETMRLGHKIVQGCGAVRGTKSREPVASRTARIACAVPGLHSPHAGAYHRPPSSSLPETAP